MISANFVSEDILKRLPDMTRDEVDALPFGAVRLSDNGKVMLYSRTESELAGIAVEHAEGKNFFMQVAPCCNNRLVYGRFKQGVASGAMDQTLPFTFTYRMRPTNVFLKMWRDGAGGNWLFIQRR